MGTIAASFTGTLLLLACIARGEVITIRTEASKTVIQPGEWITLSVFATTDLKPGDATWFTNPHNNPPPFPQPGPAKLSSFCSFVFDMTWSQPGQFNQLLYSPDVTGVLTNPKWGPNGIYKLAATNVKGKNITQELLLFTLDWKPSTSVTGDVLIGVGNTIYGWTIYKDKASVWLNPDSEPSNYVQEYWPRIDVPVTVTVVPGPGGSGLLLAALTLPRRRRS